MAKIMKMRDQENMDLRLRMKEKNLSFPKSAEIKNVKHLKLRGSIIAQHAKHVSSRWIITASGLVIALGEAPPNFSFYLIFML